MKRMNKDTCADVSLLRAGVLFPTPETADSAEFDFLSYCPITVDGAELGSDGWLAGGSILLSPKSPER